MVASDLGEGEKVRARLGPGWTDLHQKQSSGPWPLISHFRISTFHMSPGPSHCTPVTTKVGKGSTQLERHHAAFKNKKGCIHKSTHYSTICNHKILEASQMFISRRLAYGYGKSAQEVLQSC